jgi:hypothetical protein
VCDGKIKGLAPQDKNLFKTYINDVAGVAKELREAEARAKSDREAAGWFRGLAETLEYVNEYHLDTVNRL